MRPSTLVNRLRLLPSIDASTLAHVSAAGTASTSTSGTPEAGDDTVGDSSGFNNLKQIGLASLSYDADRYY